MEASLIQLCSHEVADPVDVARHLLYVLDEAGASTFEEYTELRIKDDRKHE
jgi:hypothetical protein